MRAKLSYALLLLSLLPLSYALQATAQKSKPSQNTAWDEDASYGATMEGAKKGIVVEHGIADTRKMPYYVERENDLVYWAREHYDEVDVLHKTIRGQRILVAIGQTGSGVAELTIQVYGWHKKGWHIKWIGFTRDTEFAVLSDGLNLLITNRLGKTLFKASGSTL